VLEDNVLTLPVTVSDPDTEAFLLTLTGTSDNLALVSATNCFFENTGTNRTLHLVPATNAFGTAQVTLTASDGVATATTSFTLTVQPVNDVPTLNPIPDVALADNAADFTVNLSGIGTGAANESQTLSLTVVSSNTTVAKVENASYTSPAATGTFRVDTVAGKAGVVAVSATIRETTPTTNNVVTQTFNVYVFIAPTRCPPLRPSPIKRSPRTPPPPPCRSLWRRPYPGRIADGGRQVVEYQPRARGRPGARRRGRQSHPDGHPGGQPIRRRCHHRAGNGHGLRHDVDEFHPDRDPGERSARDLRHPQPMGGRQPGHRPIALHRP